MAQEGHGRPLNETGSGRLLTDTDITVDVNGTRHTISADPHMPLLYTLRDGLGLNNPHFGCGLAQCGACKVHLDGEAIRSCVTPTAAAEGRKVVTLAGLGSPEHPHPIQRAYIDEQVPQCGFCINGWMMTAAAFLDKHKVPAMPRYGRRCRSAWR